MRARLGTLGLSSAEITSGGGKVRVTLPDVSNAAGAEHAVGRTARLYFYDWEPNVIGPDGTPQPAEATATGGPDAGASQFGLLEYQAVLRAAKRAAVLRENDTTWAAGCTPRQIGGCIYGDWYLLDRTHEKVLRGPQETEKDLYSETEIPAATKTKVVRVNPGTVLVQARAVETAAGRITQTSPNSYYVLNDDPLLSGADIQNPQQGFDEGEGGSGAPSVIFGFTAHGTSAFQSLTKKVAKRGQEAQLPGVGKEAAQQHFAVVLDGQLITAPSIDYTKYPEGVDASGGSQISGGLTINSAQELANDLRSGALPIELELISSSRHSGA